MLELELIDRVLNNKKDGCLNHYHIGTIIFKLFPNYIIISQDLYHSHFNYRKRLNLELLSNLFQVTWMVKNIDRLFLLFLQITLAETKTFPLVTLLTPMAVSFYSIQSIWVQFLKTRSTNLPHKPAVCSGISKEGSFLLCVVSCVVSWGSVFHVVDL